MTNPKTPVARIGGSLAIVAALTLTTAHVGYAQGARPATDVRVTNSAEQPIPVTLPMVAKEPVQESVTSDRSYTVPAGKWLVIEHMSGSGFTKGDGFFVQLGIRTSVDGVSSHAHFWPVTAAYDVNGSKGYFFAGPARLYAAPGTTVDTTYGVVGNTASQLVIATFSGYLTDTP